MASASRAARIASTSRPTSRRETRSAAVDGPTDDAELVSSEAAAFPPKSPIPSAASASTAAVLADENVAATGAALALALSGAGGGSRNQMSDGSEALLLASPNRA